MNRVPGLTLAFFVVAMTTVSSASGAREASPLAAGALCPFQPLQYEMTCYAPREKGMAERRFAGHPLDPSQIVRRLSGRPLTAVVDGQHLVGSTLRTSRKVTWLEYDFGPVPTYHVLTPTPVQTTTPVPTPTSTDWISVVEFPPPMIRLDGMQVESYPYGGARWKLDEELRVHHRLFVTIVANQNRTTVMAIGRGLMKRDKRG